ncbi:MAG: hypothetical protein ACYC6T_07925 [Thermoleophilia bacterium]
MGIAERARMVLSEDSSSEKALEEALSQPGVQDALVLYEEWLSVESTANPYMQAMQRSGAVATSTSSAF